MDSSVRKKPRRISALCDLSPRMRLVTMWLVLLPGAVKGLTLNLSRLHEYSGLELTTQTLMDQWNQTYDLSNPLARDNLPLDKTNVRAPHLRDCHLSTHLAAQKQKRRANGGLPEWMQGNGNDKKITVQGILEGRVHPQPPWVEGEDAANLDMTRKAQAALWLHQHPKDCRDPSIRFLIVDFWGLRADGIGSEITGITAALGHALEANRVLVITKSYRRAEHSGCVGENHGSFDCYYFPVTSPECAQVAMAIHNATNGRKFTSRDRGQKVWYPGASFGTKGKNSCPPAFCNGRPKDWTDKEKGAFSTLSVDWWSAQALRYLLRIPSEYLCRLENAVRQELFGRQVARELLKAQHRQEVLAAQGPLLSLGRRLKCMRTGRSNSGLPSSCAFNLESTKPETDCSMGRVATSSSTAA